MTTGTRPVGAELSVTDLAITSMVCPAGVAAVAAVVVAVPCQDDLIPQGTPTKES
jgi:hypothetical protein